MRAGEALPTEQDLCAGLGVSRTAVREALNRLATERLVSFRHSGAKHVLDYRRSAGLELLAALLVDGDGRIDPAVVRSVMEMRSALAPRRRPSRRRAARSRDTRVAARRFSTPCGAMPAISRPCRIMPATSGTVSSKPPATSPTASRTTPCAPATMPRSTCSPGCSPARRATSPSTPPCARRCARRDASTAESLARSLVRRGEESVRTALRALDCGEGDTQVSRNARTDSTTWSAENSPRTLGEALPIFLRHGSPRILLACVALAAAARLACRGLVARRPRTAGPDSRLLAAAGVVDPRLRPAHEAVPPLRARRRSSGPAQTPRPPPRSLELPHPVHPHALVPLLDPGADPSSASVSRPPCRSD